MTPIQRYVSHELTHFVGQARPNDEERYELLVRILRSGRLLPGGHEPGGGVMVATIGRQAICTDEMYIQDVVCFSDIPAGDLDIHMEKYGHVGLAFSKEWLIGKGANPVFYLAAGESLVYLEDQPSRRRSDYFGERIDALYLAAATLEEQVPESDPLYELVSRIHHLLMFFVQYHIFSFIKCFDPALPDNHRDNFYMEREWRVRSHVEFDLGDVRRVIIPTKFAHRLREDLPEYMGQVEFFQETHDHDAGRTSHP